MDPFLESVQFAVGLSGVTSIFTNHLLERFVDDQIDYIKEADFGDENAMYSYSLPSLAEYTKEVPFAAIFCNPHISFVTRVPWDMRSKLYIFGEMHDDLLTFSQGKGSLETKAPVKCSIGVHKPCIGIDDTLRVISDLNQPITNLFLSEIPDDAVVIEKPMFTLDFEAKCVSIDWPKMPILEQKNLANQLPTCTCIERLIIPWLTVIAQAVVPNLGNVHLLVVLNFACCQLPNEVCYSLCKHLRSMQKLEELDLRENSIGCNGTEALVDSILSWGSNSHLTYLFLGNCEISSGLELLKALTCCRKLRLLTLSHNPLAGSFKDLPPNVHFPNLSSFYLSDISLTGVETTSLTGEDIQALAAVIQNKGFPSLRVFEFEYDKLSAAKHDSLLLSDQTVESLNLADESVETLQALKCILGDSNLAATVSGCYEDAKHAFVTNIDSELQRRL